jgi:cytidine deaminase
LTCWKKFFNFEVPKKQKMTEKQITIKFHEYQNLEELPEQDRILAKEAISAMKGSYAPYSHFNVGAAIRLSNGKIVQGANQENAAFPSGLCAERTAMFAAGANYPDKDMESIAIAGGVMGRLTKSPVTPCGACRQVMAQYQTKAGRPMSVIMISDSKIWKFDRVDDILPLIFDSI